MSFGASLTKKFCTIAVFMLIAAVPAHAFTIEESSSSANINILDYIKDYVDVPKGATDWKVFGTTKQIETKKDEDEEFDYVYYKPEFAPDVETLNGKKITIKGYIFPLDGSEEQKVFLFGPFPLSCPYHYHVPPSLVLEVHADNNPVKFDYEPIVITGTLELVPDDPEYSVFYRLKDARQM